MEIPYTVKPRPDTGLYNAKLGIWLFLASEVMLFGALFSSYVLLRVGAADGTWSMGLMDVIVGAGNTMVLIASSMFVVLAWAQLKQGDLAGYKKWKWATVGCAVLFLVVKWSYEWPSKFKHYDVWFKDTAVLHAHVNEGYGKVAGTEENKAALRDEENKALGLPRLYAEKKIYVGRYFKTDSKKSQSAFTKAWEDGSLALSGHINGYEEAEIKVEIIGWSDDKGVSEADADKALENQGAKSPDDLRKNGGTLLEKTDYDTAKLAEYKLTKAGYSLALSVVGYQYKEAHPYFWRTGRVNEDIGGKPRVRSIDFGLDVNSGDKKEHHPEVKIFTKDIKRLNSYETEAQYLFWYLLHHYRASRCPRFRWYYRDALQLVADRFGNLAPRPRTVC